MGRGKEAWSNAPLVLVAEELRFSVRRQDTYKYQTLAGQKNEEMEREDGMNRRDAVFEVCHVVSLFMTQDD